MGKHDDDRTPPNGAPAVPDWQRDRPWLVLLTSHWLTWVGLALGITAISTWLFVLPTEVHGNIENPYKGAVLHLILPFLLVNGVVDTEAPHCGAAVLTVGRGMQRLIGGHATGTVAHISTDLDRQRKE